MLPSSITVYQCDEDAYFVGATQAYMDPMQYGSYIQPRGAHLLPPPPFSRGQEAQWTAAGWIIVPERKRRRRRRASRQHFLPEELPDLAALVS